ncbi:MAG: SDR family oxidoreductase [Oscillospiraceae bacterium]|nr:SDR family oxidoreductase [Oscillospiraceae bacterium]
MNRLTGKVCIVTGGAQGLGRAIVDAYANEGAAVVVSLDLKEVDYGKPNVRSKVLDTTDRAGVEALVAEIAAEFGRIDVIVNNAGILRDGLCHKLSEEDWNASMDVNLKAPHYLVAAAAPHLMSQGTGSIITLSSIIGLYGNVGQVCYSATKAAVIAMSKSWTKELSRRGGKIRANVIAPGFISTPMLDSMPQDILAELCKKVLFKEPGKPEDIANAAVFFASDESRYITGQVLEISGGVSL